MSAKNYTLIDDLIKKYQSAVSPHKEAEPILTVPEKNRVQEAVEHEKKDLDLKAMGVQIHPETIKLPNDLKKVGIQADATSRFPSYKNIQTPLSDEKVLIGLHEPITSSFRWLATLAIYILKQAHLTLKVIQGKTVRVFKK